MASVSGNQAFTQPQPPSELGTHCGGAEKLGEMLGLKSSERGLCEVWHEALGLLRAALVQNEWQKSLWRAQWLFVPPNFQSCTLRQWLQLGPVLGQFWCFPQAASPFSWGRVCLQLARHCPPPAICVVGYEMGWHVTPGVFSLVIQPSSTV